MMHDPRTTLISMLRGAGARAAPARGEARAWEHLLIHARDEGVCGLLIEAIRRDGVAVPPDVAAKLRAQVEHIAEANRSGLGHLMRVAGAFHEEGVNLMALKGAALVLGCYRDPGLRPMCDIDVLIRPEAADRADRLLERLGYRRGKHLVRKDFYPRFHYEAEYLGGMPEPVRFDVHVRPWRPLRYARLVPVDAFWKRASTAAALHTTHTGHNVTVPGDAEMFIHLLCHAAFHGATRLLWLLDVQRFAATRGRGLDWTRFVSLLRAWRLVHAARFALDRVESTLGRFVPDEVRDELAAERVSWRDRLALWQSPRDADSPWMHTLVDGVCTDGLAFRMGYLRAVLLPDASHLAEGYRSDHRGWVACAHARRASSAVRRLLWPIRPRGERSVDI